MASETIWYKNVSLDVNNKCFDVNFKLDPVAEVNILPLYILIMFKVNLKLSKTNISITTYVNVKSKPILGLRGCKELKLIERIDAIECSISKNEKLIKQHKDVFTGVGEFPNEPYHITLKDNAVPVIHSSRRVPLTLQPKLKSTLDRLEKEGIVSKVNKPTDWVQSLVIVEKPNGNLRLCLDPRDLKMKLALKFVHLIHLLEGCDEDSHDAIMSRVLERAKLLNIKFKPDKLQYRVSEVKYVGQIVSKSGVKPDPDHIKVIVEMPTPKSKTEVRRLLDMMNFLSKFIPNVSKVAAPLREIIHENVEFNWEKNKNFPL
ncbi:transposon Tf2-9 polyprotein [Trichonephila clavipes]|nr:transposon Tf2-9 polyprotein [Trichonephila clavipes]